MRKWNLLLLFISAIPVLLFAEKPKYCIKVKINGLKDTVCYIGNYYGDKQYIKDTAKVDHDGYCEFKGEEELPGGIYLIVTPEKKFFEIIINNSKDLFISVETDSSDFIGKMKIKGSPENQLFYNYLNYINTKQKEAEPLRKVLKKLKGKDTLKSIPDKHAETSKKDSLKLVQDKLIAIDKEVQKYKLDFIALHPDAFLSKVFKASYDPDIPEAPLLPNGRKDSNYVYQYYKKHFLDNIDFSDDRLLRTPVFHNKIKQYITSVTVQHPDSIIKEADTLIEKARANKEVFKYVVWYLTNWSETSNIMGFDAVFVHLVEKYYMTNQAYWVSPTNLEKITNRGKILKGILLGTSVPNLAMQDTNGIFISLYNIKTKYTILYFWDPTCGHCQKETPQLYTLYDSVKTNNVGIYAVCTDINIDEWKKFIRAHHLNWINVMDMQNTTGFRTTFDIYSTPVIYLLDENKKILAKRLSVEQLRDFLEMMIKKDKEKTIKKTN